MSRFDLFFILVDECNEVTDYAIARRIVDLHARNQESVERVYSVEDMQRYLMFARQFKPKVRNLGHDNSSCCNLIIIIIIKMASYIAHMSVTQ